MGKREEIASAALWCSDGGRSTCCSIFATAQPSGSGNGRSGPADAGSRFRRAASKPPECVVARSAATKQSSGLARVSLDWFPSHLGTHTGAHLADASKEGGPRGRARSEQAVAKAWLWPYGRTLSVGKYP